MNILDTYVQVHNSVYDHEADKWIQQPFICKVLVEYKDKGTTCFIGLTKEGDFHYFTAGKIMKIFNIGEPGVDWIKELEKQLPLTKIDI